MADELNLGTHAGLTLRALPAGSEARRDLEEEAVRSGVPFSLHQRAAWDAVSGARDAWLVVVTDGEGGLLAAFSVRRFRSRALPFHSILRAERFLGAVTPRATAAALCAAAELARRLPRMLRVHVELFDPTGQARAPLSSAAAAAGFTRWDAPRLYRRTVTIDLAPDEETIFSGLHATARRHIRAQDKNPVTVRPVEPGFPARRLQDLLRETMGRTGGGASTHAWEEILGLSADRPDLSRVVGLFREDLAGPESLLAFAWGCHHGAHAHYATAASTRATDLNLPMGYPLAWDLICWAKENGATVFDFGGISRGTAESGDPLGGITDFKRRFTKAVVDAGEEWVYTPRPGRARLSRIGPAAKRLLRQR